MKHRSLLFVLIALLSAAIMFTGCPTGSSSDPDTGTDGGDNTGGSGGGGGGGGASQLPPSGGTGDASAAEQLKNDINEKAGYAVVGLKASDNTTVEVLQNFVVGPTPSQSVAYTRFSDVVVYYVSGISIPAGVSLWVPDARTVTVDKGTISVAGTSSGTRAAAITIDKRGEIRVKANSTISSAGPITVIDSGKLVIEKNATVTVQAAGTIDVKGGGKVEAAGGITVQAAGKIVVETDGKVEAAGTITVAAQATIEVAGTVQVQAGGIVTNNGTLSGTGGKLVVDTDGTVTLQGTEKADLSGFGKVEVAGKIESTVDVNLPKGSESAASNITTGKTITVENEKLAFDLTGTAVNYNNASSNALTVTFTFGTTVITGVTNVSPGWGTPTYSGNTVTATYSGTKTGPETEPLSLTALASEGSVSVTGPTVYAVSSTALARSKTYTIADYYEVLKNTSTIGAYTVVGLKEVTGGVIGSTVTYYVVPDSETTGLAATFKAIYEPNKADSAADSIENGKSAVSYNDAISGKVLDLFQIALGASTTDDKVNLTGSALPATSDTGGLEASNGNLIVIDIGIPGIPGETNTLKAYIPIDTSKSAGSQNSTLGTSTGNYAHIRLRVNKGAELVVLADNSNYASSGSCPAGLFNNGCIEAMEGGKIRDGAQQGFPLGANAVIVNHPGSYLSVGPEEDFDKGNASFFSGYLIGPSGSGNDAPRIVWDASNTSGYLEVRNGELAISGNVTVRKNLLLIYSVWFVGKTQITIDIPASGGDVGNEVISGKNGLYSGDLNVASPSTSDLYNFYGTSDATIVIKPDNYLHKAFLTGVGTDTKVLLKGAGTINGTNTGAPKYYPSGTTTIPGYPTWSIPAGITEDTTTLGSLS